MGEDKNICLNCKAQVEKVGYLLNLSGVKQELFEKPQRVITFRVAYKKDDGTRAFANGYRVQYNDALGPAKGGIRYHPKVDLEEVKNLAFLMALKTSLAGLPLGGGKGGVEIDPSILSDTEKESLSRGFVRQIYRSIGPEVDIPAPDLNTNSQIMDWMTDEYSKLVGTKTLAAFTGKSLENGGSEGRVMATSLGGASVLRGWVKQKKLDPEKLRVVIQGFGNVGSNIAKILHSWGYTVVGISDSSGGLYNPKGIEIPELCTLKGGGTSLKDCEGGEHISNDELLELDCDILIPAALSDQITHENADNITAQVILEMANAPVAPNADKILAQRDIEIIPDILANAGGVIVSYYEWYQNMHNEIWTEKEVNSRLEEQLTRAFKAVRDVAKGEKTIYRTASYTIAMRRILDAEKKRRVL